uniref:UBA domain-containing protein n=1 Tax=Heterorhabditis bacteriophora TaxID=37862 RepID=A0A1I7WD22_HETBA
MGWSTTTNTSFPDSILLRSLQHSQGYKTRAPMRSCPPSSSFQGCLPPSCRQQLILHSGRPLLPLLNQLAKHGLTRELAQSELLAQQTITAVSTASSAATTSSSIFPSPIVNMSSNKSSCNSPNDNAPTQTSPTNGHMSSAPSSHPSTSTTQEIDVGSISQPASQTQAYDLSIRGSPPLNTSPSAAAEQSPVTNTRPVSSQPATPKSNAITKTNSQLPAQVGIQAPMEDNWAGIDLGDLDLFVGSTTKENEAAMSSVLDLGVANLFPDNMGAFTETPNKTNNFSIAALAQPNTSHPEIAVADQEFDRIFSSFVTEPTESTSATTSTFPFDFHSGDNNPSLSPVQFTPPDSPTANTPEPDVMGIFGGPSTSGVQTASVSTTFIPSANPAVMPSIAKRKIDTFKPTVSTATSQSSSFKKEPLLTRPVQKCNKIPVYKQKKATMIVPDEENSKIKTESNDAYSFDDDDDGGLGPMDPREKLDAEVQE